LPGQITTYVNALLCPTAKYEQFPTKVKISRWAEPIRAISYKVKNRFAKAPQINYTTNA